MVVHGARIRPRRMVTMRFDPPFHPHAQVFEALCASFSSSSFHGGMPRPPIVPWTHGSESWAIGIERTETVGSDRDLTRVRRGRRKGNEPPGWDPRIGGDPKGKVPGDGKRG